MSVTINPCGPISGRIRPPGSKSITNRALVCAALARGTSELVGALQSEDTQVMLDGLRKLGLAISVDDATRQIVVVGCGGQLPVPAADLYVAGSGTTIRFLTALATLGHGRYRLDGNARMRQRPIADLLEALAQLGADVRAELDNGCPPVIVHGAGLPGGRAQLRGDLSSQFLSGLLMIAPYAQREIDLAIEGPLVSQPYVHLTLQVMSAFGISIEHEQLRRFTIPSGRHYRACRYEIEPDASAASYFWAAAAISGGRVTVDGLTQESLQGDVQFCHFLSQMGCDVQYSQQSITVSGGQLRGIDADMNAVSDTVQTLAAVALFASGPTTIRGVAHIRHKETDRIGDLVRELQRLGAEVEQREDGLRITPAPLHAARIETYHDHRMAMSLALVGLRVAGVEITNPGCTDKTYPEYFTDLQRLIGDA